MKSFIIFVFAIAAVCAYPHPIDEPAMAEFDQGEILNDALPMIYNDDQEQKEINVLDEYEPHVRAKRATCDLLSFGGKVNHSACAAHCLAKGFRGGYCNSQAVCNCRR